MRYKAEPSTLRPKQTQIPIEGRNLTIYLPSSIFKFSGVRKMLFQRSSVILLATFNNVLGHSVHGRGIGRRGDTPNLPYDPSTTTECDYWYDNEADSLTCNDILDIFGVSLADFRALVSVVLRCLFSPLFPVSSA